MYYLELNTARLLRKNSIFRRWKYYSIAKNIENVEIDKIRNIGILAHIDAGKTTTTERMLFYSGIIQQMGEVHHGNTVTDFMLQERERGITITSAAVTFYWRKNQFNLIDTPGHIDFTMEVEQTLNVLDGAIVILDGSAGVEAQTQTVWRQANRYSIPRIVYVNKMDRNDADIKMCCESIEKKLDSSYLLLQLPLLENRKLVGIIDILSMQVLKYGTKDKLVKQIPLTEADHPKEWNDSKLARSLLIDRLTDYSDELANTVISSDSMDNVPTVDIIKALRLVTYKQVATPVLLGSSYKNIGVQSLMDAVILYLPSPNERNQQFSSFEDNLCAKAFKVKHDKQKGPLVFFRIYNGTFSKGQKLYNIQKDSFEQAGKLYIAYADEYKEVDNVKNGNIAVLAGLKKTVSGDLVTNSSSICQKAKKNLSRIPERNDMTEADVEKLLGMGVTIPEPVFFCSIEPPSLASQSYLEQALTELQREDPSLRVSYNPETEQIILAGMGELHLDIIKDRILKEYKIDADLGPLQIAYRESPVTKLTDSLTVETKIGSSRQFITVKLSIFPSGSSENNKDVMKLDKSHESASNIASIFPKHLKAVRQGIEVGLAHGPKINCQVVNIKVMLHFLEVGRGTSETMVAATVTQLIQKMLKEASTIILEPLMHLEVATPEDYLSSVLGDLSKRRAIIKHIGMRGNTKIVITTTPLSELMGYSTILRTLSSGTATFTMEFIDYGEVSPADEADAIRNVRGF